MQKKYNVMSMTYRIYFIYLPISVTGPEGPSYVSNVKLGTCILWNKCCFAKKCNFVFFGVVYLFSILLPFFTVLLWTFIGFKSGIIMCGQDSSVDMMNFLVESGWRTWIFFQFGKIATIAFRHGLPITKFASTLCLNSFTPIRVRAGTKKLVHVLLG